MIQVRNLLLGALAFVVVHLGLVTTWQTWFQGGGGHAPWFMNSNQSVAFTVVIFAIVGLLVAMTAPARRMDVAIIGALNAAVGAMVPMVITMFLLPGAPGNLFPIAIAIGFLIVAAGALAGVFAAWGIRVALDRLAHPAGPR